MNFKTSALIGLTFVLGQLPLPATDWSLPVRMPDRRSLKNIELTAIGQFGLRRKARPGVPAHLHTGVDIRRPGDNYADEPVFPAARGIVISTRDDGPFAQVIIEHRQSDGAQLWTVYEHIAGIRAAVGNTVDPMAPVARFMTRPELDRYGWQFDHLHFEVLRQRPQAMAPTTRLPQRIFGTFALACRDSGSLLRHCQDPRTFLENAWRRQ